MTRMSVEKAKELGFVPKSKYHNKKVTIDGIAFDSQKEAKYYMELLLRQRIGEVTEIKLQPIFELQAAFKRKGRLIRAITYKADFEITLANGKVQVIDVKGCETEVYKIKRKMFQCKWPEVEFIEIR